MVTVGGLNNKPNDWLRIGDIIGDNNCVGL